MSNFTGAKCEYCKKTFVPDDDVVVCPDCGTPYHRDCYNEAGECINFELHERGGDWAHFHSDRVDFSSVDNEEETQEDVRCPRCGETNPSTGLFCLRCGMPLNKNQEARPFNNVNGQNYGGYNPYGNNENQQGMPFGMGQQPFAPQTINLKEVDIDGHKGGEYAKFAKKSFLYYVANFFNFSKNKTKTSFNISAILFTEYFFMYRKMYGIGILLNVLFSLAAIPSMLLYMIDGTIPSIGGFFDMFFPNAMDMALPSVFVNNIATIESIAMICSVVTMILRIVCGFFANYWYFNKAKKTLNEIKNMDLTDEQKDEIIAQKGGTSGLGLAVSLTLNLAIVMAGLVAVIAFFK